MATDKVGINVKFSLGKLLEFYSTQLQLFDFILNGVRLAFEHTNEFKKLLKLFVKFFGIFADRLGACSVLMCLQNKFDFRGTF